MLRVLSVDFEQAELLQVQDILNLGNIRYILTSIPGERILDPSIDLEGFDLCILRELRDGRTVDGAIRTIRHIRPTLHLFVVSNTADELRTIALQNAGADRICSVQSLSKCLSDCLQAFFGEGLAKNANTIHEAGVRYELPVGLQQLQARLQEDIGTPNFLESLLNTFSSIVIVLDFEGHILFVNHRAELVSGYTFDELRGRNFRDLLLLPEEENGVLSIINQLRNNEGSNQYQNSWLTRSGEVRRIEWSNMVIQDRASGLRFFISMGLDITEEYEKNRALRESEERFSKIFHANPFGMAILDYSEGRILDANNRFKGIFQAKTSEVIGKSLHELGLLQPSDHWEADLLLKIQRTSLFTLERKVLFSDRRLLHLLMAFDLVVINGVSSILLTLQDLTERMEMEEKTRRFAQELEGNILERSAALEAANRGSKTEMAFRKVLESSTDRLTQIIWETPDIVAIADLAGRLQYLNKAGRQILGIDETDPVSNLSVYSVYSQQYGEFINRNVRPQVEANGVWRGETELHMADGRGIPISQGIIGHRDVNGQIQFFSSIARDISDFKRASEELRLAYEKEKELGRLRASFFSMTSHQFRTPLSTILSSAELLEHYGSQWPEEKRLMHTQRIQDATMRLSEMLNEILEYSKIESRQGHTQVEAVYLEDLCLKIMNDLRIADHEQHLFDLSCGSEPCIVYSDRLSLELVVENLFSNAIKFSPVGSTISVKIEENQGWVSLTVRDEGIGILPSEQETIFEPFHRGSNVVDTPGSGLGLMIVRKSLELIRGEISVRSGEGQGTEIIIKIPDLRG